MPLLVFAARESLPHVANGLKLLSRAGGRHIKEPYEGWIAADPFRGGVRIVITDPQGFERTVLFALDEDPAIITQHVRETIEE